MAEQAWQKANKALTQARENELSGHAAVRPWAGLEQQPAREMSPSNGRDMSQAAVRAAAPFVGRDYGASTCPLAPTRCPYGGVCHACPARVQAKLILSRPGDEYEQEADRMAEWVTYAAQGQLQRRATGRVESTDVPPIVHEVLRSPGQPLDPPTRALMEPRFGHNFSGVRLHTGAQATESARAIDAVAYTYGQQIVFAEGQYVPQTTVGRRLLAHELTHVVQQQGARYLGPRAPARIQRAKGGLIGAGAGALVGGLIGGLLGGVPGAIIGGLVGAGAGALVGYLLQGSKVTVDSSCKSFCPGVDIEKEAGKTDTAATSEEKDVKFTYQVQGESSTRTFDKKIEFNSVTVKCDKANPNCGGWSSSGTIALGKSACSEASCGPMASTILHEMVHDWAGWGPPYDKQNVTVPGATHTAADYLDEWIARYVEKACFKTDPWGLP